MSCPVAERVSSRRRIETSLSEGTTFSIDVTHDMRLRQQARQIAVAFVGDDERGAGFGHQEIRARDPRIRRLEMPAHDRTRLRHQRRAVVEHTVGVELTMRIAEVLLHLGPVQMERGRHDVARFFLAQLDDVFAEIGLDRREAALLEMSVQLDLFRHHGLALGDVARAALFEDRGDDARTLRPHRAPNARARHSPSRALRTAPATRPDARAHARESRGRIRASPPRRRARPAHPRA